MRLDWLLRVTALQHLSLDGSGIDNLDEASLFDPHYDAVGSEVLSESESESSGPGEAGAGAQIGLLPNLRTLKLSDMALIVSRDNVDNVGTPRLVQLTQLLDLSVAHCEGFVPSVLEALPGLQVGETTEPACCSGMPVYAH